MRRSRSSVDGSDCCRKIMVVAVLLVSYWWLCVVWRDKIMMVVRIL